MFFCGVMIFLAFVLEKFIVFLMILSFIELIMSFFKFLFIMIFNFSLECVLLCFLGLMFIFFKKK